MRIRPVIILVLLVFLVACGTPEPTVTLTDTPAPPPGPTATSTPGSPLVILVLPADLPQEQADLYQGLVYDLAQANAMRFQVRNTLTPEDLLLEGTALKVVIALPPDPGLAALVAAAPGVQFLAVNVPLLAPAPNLTTIGAEGLPLDSQAFVAGYIAAMITEDYHIGILTMNDAQGLSAETAYANGKQFYCGLCQKAFGPWYDYPIRIEIPTDEMPVRYNPYSDHFVSFEVDVVYVYPGVATPELFDYMAEKGLYIISQDMPASHLQSSWVVSLKPDMVPAIQDIFPALLAGTGGQTISIPMTLDDVNPDLLSEGKLRLAQQLLEDLQAGRIGTGLTP